MTDAEFIMRSEARAHKANGRAVYSRASRGGSKYCSLPSDNMTKAQIKKMNGNVVTLQMNKPITWKQFKKYPKDLQKEYLENIVTNYGARNVDVAKMFELEKSHCSKRIQEIAPGIFEGHRRKQIDPRWEAFISSETEDTQKEELEKIEEKPSEHEAEPVVEKSYDSMHVNTIHGNVSFKGDPYAVFAKAIKLFDEEKYYTITISFREENVDAEA